MAIQIGSARCGGLQERPQRGGVRGAVLACPPHARREDDPRGAPRRLTRNTPNTRYMPGVRPHFRKMHFSKMHFSKLHFSKILQIFGGLVLGCIKTKICKKICVRQHFSSSTRLYPFAPLQPQIFRKNLAKNFKILAEICKTCSREDDFLVDFEKC